MCHPHCCHSRAVCFGSARWPVALSVGRGRYQVAKSCKIARLKMDKTKFAGRVLQLTLEIIYLLTGEDYIIMKKSSDHMTSNSHSGQRKNQPHSPNEQKILEVANSIIHLLTGEVLSCSEDWEEPCEVPLDEPITSQALSRSSRKREASRFQMTLPNHCEESEYVDGSHRASNLTKGRKGSVSLEQRAPKVGGLQGTDQFQVYPLCPPTPTPRNQEVAVSKDDCDGLEYTTFQFKEELVTRKEGDLEEGQLADVDSSTRNHYQAYKDGSKGGKCRNVPSQSHLAEDTDFTHCETFQLGEQLRASSPTVLKAKPYKCPECPRIFTCYSDLLQHQTHHQGSLVSSMPCDRHDADCQDLWVTLLQAEEGLGKGSLSKAKTSTPKRLPQPKSCSHDSSEVSDATNHHKDVEYVLVENKEEPMLVEQRKGDLAKVKTLQTWTNDDRSKGKDLSRTSNQLRFLNNNEGSSSQLSMSPTAKTLNYQSTEGPKCFNRVPQLVQHQKTHQKSLSFTCPPSGDREPPSPAHEHKDLDYVLVEIKEEFEGVERDLEDDVDEPEASSSEDDGHLEAFEADAFNTQGQPIGREHKTTKGVTGLPGQLATFPSPIPNAMIYKCQECPDVFNCRSDLLKHQTHHRGSTLFSCSVCEKNFTSKSNLAKHHKIHTGEKPYSCAECGKSFREKHYLASHQAVHNGAQLLTCPVCGKGYTSKSNLAKHQRIHTGQKPFACSICGKSFNQRSVLLAHQRTHTGEKPFSCQLCQRRFTDKLQLERHQITHTGEKPFSCSRCGKGFTRKNILVKHLASH